MAIAGDCANGLNVSKIIKIKIIAGIRSA